MNADPDCQHYYLSASFYFVTNVLLAMIAVCLCTLRRPIFVTYGPTMPDIVTTFMRLLDGD